MEDFVNMDALDEHFTSLARQIYLEEHAKEAGMSKRELHELVRSLVQQRAFNLTQASKYLGKSVAYVSELVKKGELRVCFHGKTKYYRKEDLDAWIDSGNRY